MHAKCLGLIVLLAVTQLMAGPQALAGEEPLPSGPYAYLFTHMTVEDYGPLYYSISRDGLHFERLNGGKRIIEEAYRGHSSVTRGHDGRFYLSGGGSPAITFWVTPDFLSWEKYSEYAPDVLSIPKFAQGRGNSGAPKVFYDDQSEQYIVTWQTAMEKKPENYVGIPEIYWGSQRALYSLSKDLKSFTEPKELFPEIDIPAIDIVITRAGGKYYAIFKDETYPRLDYTWGKSIRVAVSDKVEGPYSEPGPSASPNFREAPSVVPRPDGKGWYMYYEEYPDQGYEIATAADLEGPWYTVYFHERDIPADTRHGFVFPLTQEQYESIMSTYGN